MVSMHPYYKQYKKKLIVSHESKEYRYDLGSAAASHFSHPTSQYVTGTEKDYTS